MRKALFLFCLILQGSCTIRVESPIPDGAQPGPIMPSFLWDTELRMATTGSLRTVGDLSGASMGILCSKEEPKNVVSANGRRLPSLTNDHYSELSFSITLE